MKKPLYLSLGITLTGILLLLLLAAVRMNVGIIASLIIILAAPMWPLVMVIEQILPFPLPANISFYMIGTFISFPYYWGLLSLFFYNKKNQRRKRIAFRCLAITIFVMVTLFNVGLQFLLLTANFAGH